MTYIGIDVSKETFVVAYSSEKNSPTKTFKNTTKGIHEFIQTISKDEHHCVMEATGNYSSLLVYLLSRAGIKTSLENPLKIKYFARSVLSVVKTDVGDARLIALYSERAHPAPYVLPSDPILILKQKRTVLRQFKKQLIINKNLMESMEALPFIDPICKKSIEKIISLLEKQIKDLEEDLLTLANNVYEKQMKLLTSIKGIGTTLASALIIATGGFTLFDNAQKFTRYLGLSPTYQQSGTSVHIRGHINRNGDPILRSQLYMATCSSIKYNKECKAFYERLKAKGKPGKVAIIAAANKLIRQAFAVITHETPYIDGFVSNHHSQPTPSGVSIG